MGIFKGFSPPERTSEESLVSVQIFSTDNVPVPVVRPPRTAMFMPRKQIPDGKDSDHDGSDDNDSDVEVVEDAAAKKSKQLEQFHEGLDKNVSNEIFIV